MSDQISGIQIRQSLKNVQNALSPQEKALPTQNVMLFGEDGLPNGKAPLTTKGVVDANTGKSLDDTLKYLVPVTDDELYVDLGLPSGLRWARRNMDASQANGFAASEYQYECSFVSWGNTDAHNPVSNSSFGDYSFGSSNDEEPYASSEGASIVFPSGAAAGSVSFGPSYDAARKGCNAPWRIPTTAEFKELFDNCDFVDADGNAISAETTDKRITMNGIMGIRLKSKNNGKFIFFPCSGYGNGSSWINRGSYGYYWSASLNSAAYGRDLYFSSGGVNPQYGNNRFNGFAVRPVQ